MEFEWDEEKRKANLAKHDIDFEDVSQIFENTTVTDVDDRFDYGETRFFTLGLFRNSVVVVSHTESDEIIRVISIRKASRYEQEIYFKSIKN